MSGRVRAALRRRRDERGAVATLTVMLLASGVIMAFAAFGVDTARWYVEVQRVQKAADAAALAGVPFLPQDLSSAVIRAKAVAARNGYDDASPDVVVKVERGSLASQLRVTIESRIRNAVGGAIGVPFGVIVETSVADYQAPAPMGSPCNTFGNEPRAGAGASSPEPRDISAMGHSPMSNCSRVPEFWAGIQGQRTNKSNGDRYMNTYCPDNTTFRCSGGGNAEAKAVGYFWVVRVQPAAVGKPVDLQLYDPAYVNTGNYKCASLPTRDALSEAMNPFVTNDGKNRYSSNEVTATAMAPFCNGDHRPASTDGGDTTPPTTTFALRSQTDTQDPTQAPVIPECVRQYKGLNTVPTVALLKSGTADYEPHLAQVFHNWTRLCTFIPPRSGDYYLQVRTNVTAAGTLESPVGTNETALIYKGTSAAWAATGNTTTGNGNNTFAMRAVMPSGLEKSVSVAGFDRMPIFANADSATSEFNLIKVLPGSRGQHITFSFYDAADAADAGTVRVVPPFEATGSIKTTPFPGGCKTYYGETRVPVTPLVNCQTPVTGAANNFKLQTIEIPIPTDYNCDVLSSGGCWYKVEVAYGAGGVHDFTTWDATILGDPVRLVE